jgi:hypothetical protein
MAKSVEKNPSSNNVYFRIFRLENTISWVSFGLPTEYVVGSAIPGTSLFPGLISGRQDLMSRV